MTMTRKIVLALVGVLGVLALALWLAPKEALVERLLTEQLQQRGMENIRFRVASVGLGSVRLEEVMVDGARPLALSSLELNFSLRELWQGQLRDLTLSNVTLSDRLASVAIERLRLVFSPAEQGIKARWSAENIQIAQELLPPFPPLAGEGALSFGEDQLVIDGKISDAQKSYHAQFALTHAFDARTPSQLVIDSLALPWSGGVVQLAKTLVPYAPSKAFDVTLQLQGVSLDALMQLATGGKAHASGAVSGTVPMRVDAAGKIRILNSRLATAAPGTLSLAQDAIPGDNAQVALVRDILKDFRYQSFALSLEPAANDKLSMLLQLSGHNPDVYNGKEVKLNVRLNGDLQSLLQQNILSITNPAQLLQQE